MRARRKKRATLPEFDLEVLNTRTAWLGRRVSHDIRGWKAAVHCVFSLEPRQLGENCDSSVGRQGDYVQQLRAARANAAKGRQHAALAFG